MTKAHATEGIKQLPAGRGPSARDAPLYAALDLGTNNCRLLIAAPTPHGFRVVEAFSRIVRLGEGLSQSGRLDPAAMDRAIEALQICAEKLKRRRPERTLAVATQACRSASNGEAFVARVGAETGLRLRIITPREEAHLEVAGCLALLDRTLEAALVLDVGGGSTELSWVDLTDPAMSHAHRLSPDRLPIRAWTSVPIGVVTLAEQFPERLGADHGWFRQMVDHVKTHLTAQADAETLRPVFDMGRAHLVGTSGAITSLAGVHLGLERYDRNRVDGLWLTRADCEQAADFLLGLNPRERASQPCIGVDRADLVLAGAAILQAVQEVWPCERVRVADRGLREGLLMSLIQQGKARRRRRRPRPIAQA